MRDSAPTSALGLVWEGRSCGGEGGHRTGLRRDRARWIEDRRAVWDDIGSTPHGGDEEEEEEWEWEGRGRAFVGGGKNTGV